MKAINFSQIAIGYFFLTLAIAGEIFATTFLKVASDERALWWVWVIVGSGYIFSYWMLSLSLAHGVPLGIAYAIWAGIGVVAVAIISWFVFNELLTWQQMLGIVLVIGGIVLLEVGG